MNQDGNGYEERVGGRKWRSCGVARSIIVGFHPADPGSNPGTSILLNKAAVKRFMMSLIGHAIDEIIDNIRVRWLVAVGQQ